jgi:hypothetical protein
MHNNNKKYKKTERPCFLFTEVFAAAASMFVVEVWQQRPCRLVQAAAAQGAAQTDIYKISTLCGRSSVLMGERVCVERGLPQQEFEQQQQCQQECTCMQHRRHCLDAYS